MVKKHQINNYDVITEQLEYLKVENLEDEIIKRYFYCEGLYKYYSTHDDAI